MKMGNMVVLEWWDPGCGWERDAFESTRDAYVYAKRNGFEEFSIFEVKRVFKQEGGGK